MGTSSLAVVQGSDAMRRFPPFAMHPEGCPGERARLDWWILPSARVSQ